MKSKSQKPRKKLSSWSITVCLTFTIFSVMNFASMNASASYDETIIWIDGETIQDEIREYPSNGNDSTLIRLIKISTGADLEIKNNGTLIFNDNVTFQIETSIAGEFGIKIEVGGSFVINSSLGNVTIKSDPANPGRTYPFTNSGTIDFLGATVKRVYGPSNTSISGGIKNNPGSVCNLTNCDIEDADTHSLYFEGNASTAVEVNISNLTIDQVASGTMDGSGIWIEGNSDVVIDDVKILKGDENGIKCINADDVTIQNSEINDVNMNGLLISNSTVIIKNTTIEEVGADSWVGIYIVNDSNVTIQNGTTIKSTASHGISYENSIGVVRDSSIYFTHIGIFSSNSIVNIINNNIYNNSIHGIQLTDSQECTISGNYIANNSANGIYIINSTTGYSYNNMSLGFDVDSNSYSDETFLVKLKPGFNSGQPKVQLLNELDRIYSIKPIKEYEYSGLLKFNTNPILGCGNIIQSLSKDDRILYVEPDYYFNRDNIPNDPGYNDSLWGLHNFGQNSGTFDADIDAEEAWDITTGSSDIVVAIIDGGIDYFHRDLAGNMWINPGETAGNGLDDDGNGYIDDIYGIDAVNGDSDPFDDDDHGSHCAGTIGAVGDNSLFLTGINWDVSMMALKAFPAVGMATNSDLIECIEYMIMMKKEKNINIKVSSNSWSSGVYSQAIYDAISACRDENILFVAAAGNAGYNADYQPRYPGAFDLTNIISVASSDRNDTSAGHGHNWGAASVDVAAPGYEINSTIRNNSTAIWSGTSMATPHVSGLAALIASTDNSYDYNNLKYLILSTVDSIPDYSNKLVTEGRINAYSALSYNPSSTYMHMIVHSPGNSSNVLKGVPVEITVSVSNAEQPITNASLFVQFSTGDSNVTLYDNGVGVDQVSGDGYYSGLWTPSHVGVVYLNISGTSDYYTNINTNVTLNVLGSNVISNNEIINNGDYGIELYDNCDGNIIYNNTISLNNIGIYIYKRSEFNKISYNNISFHYGYGIYIRYCLFNEIDNNHIWNNSFGIRIFESSGINIHNNHIWNDSGYYDVAGTKGIRLNEVNNLNISNNVISNYEKGITVHQSYNVLLEGNYLGLWFHHYILNETVAENCAPSDLGPFYLDNGYVINITLYELFMGNWTKLVKGSNYSLDHVNGEINILLIRAMVKDFNRSFYAYYNYSENGAVGSNEYGIICANSYGLFVNNRVNYSTDSGISVSNSDVTLTNNSAFNSTYSGFYISGCDNLTFNQNNGSHNDNHGFYIIGSNHLTLVNNTAYSNEDNGIFLTSSSDYNDITSNTLISNGCGINATNTENNSIYHNKLFSNTDQAYDAGANNSWDDGYPSGGNYWNDYYGTDIYGGPEQNLSGCDGIGDVHYNSSYGYGINGTASSEDSYPIMSSSFLTYDYWAKAYGGTSYDEAYCVDSTTDGGSIVVGHTWSYGTFMDCWILKLDEDGVIDWEKTIGGSSLDGAYSVQQTDDDGFVIAGYTYSDGAGSSDTWVIKLDENGTMVWNITYGGSSGETGYDIHQTEDGGYIVASSTTSFGAGGTDYWIMKLYPNGTMKWNKTYGNSSADVPYSITQTSDDGYIVAGKTNSFGAGLYDYWVLKLNENGNVTWEKTYGETGTDYAYSILESGSGPSSDYVVSGYSSNGTSYDYWILKLNHSGNVTWEKKYGGANTDHLYSIQETSDKGIIMTGNTNSFGAGGWDNWVVKLYQNGSIEWQKSYGGTGNDVSQFIQVTSEGDFMVAGYTSSFGNGPNDFWVQKLGANGGITYDWGSGAFVNDTSVTPVDTNCSEGTTNCSVNTTTATIKYNPNMFEATTSCGVEIQATPSYGWY